LAAIQVDALVIGAGPAGTAAARALALDGARVALVDRHAFPRDKVCGDALIPDALGALAELGVAEDVLRVARRVDRLRVYAPNHSFLTLAGACACLARVDLDDRLRQAAVSAGARFIANLRATEPIVDGVAVRGARFEDAGSGARVEIDAPFTILATGAAAEVLSRFGVCVRTHASATAARLYIKVAPEHAARFDHLCIAYSRAICPGYGWIFPGPGDVFNVGVGYFYDAPRLPAEKNVRRLLQIFLEDFPPAVELMRHATVVSELKGAPLRTAMAGAALARPGLLVAGEAAGLTYSFSGEGIGKALESGLIAARIVRQYGGATPASIEAAAVAYDTTLRSRFADRFAAYASMQRWLARPLFLDFLARRGNAGCYIRQQLEDLLNDRGTPRALFSARGLLKSVIS
jgi:geranylgeranyl reductase family protein